MRRGPSWLERVAAAVLDHQDGSGLQSWTSSFAPDPKWHRKDRLTVLDRKGRQVLEAHFRIRKDGTGLCFSRDGSHWHEAVMAGFDRRAAASCLLVCAFLHGVPGDRQRGLLGEPGISPVGDLEVKVLQHRIRHSARGWNRFDPVWPRWMVQSLDVLKVRHDQLSGADVEEEIRRLERPFRFLASKGVPFERIRTAWDEAACAEVMDA